MLGFFLFDGHSDWIEGNYQQFVKPAVARGNITAILIGNEDPQMTDTITQYLQKAKANFLRVPVATSQTISFWLTDGGAAQLLPLVFRRRQHLPGLGLDASGRQQPAYRCHTGIRVQFLLQHNNQIQKKYSGRQVVVTETGWPTTFGPIPAQQFPIGISLIDYAGNPKGVLFQPNG